MEGKTAIITGVAGGIGSAIALRFAEEGANIFICDLEQSAGKEIEERISQKGGKAISFPMNVTSESDWEKISHRSDKP